RVSELILSKPDDSGSITYLALEEFGALGGDHPLKGTIELCRQGRGPGARVCMVSQSVEDLRRIYGMQGAAVMLGQSGNKLLLRTEAPPPAKFGSEVVGEGEVWEKDPPPTNGRGGSSTSERWNRARRPAVLDSDFLCLPAATPAT